MGSDRFRKNPLYAHDKSANHAGSVMRNDHMDIPLKNTPIRKAVVRLQKEQAGLFKHCEKPPHCNPNVKSLFVCLLFFLLNYVIIFIGFVRPQSPDLYHRDMGQPAHPAGQVILACHLPRDKFCQKNLSDAGLVLKYYYKRS